MTRPKFVRLEREFSGALWDGRTHWELTDARDADLPCTACRQRIGADEAAYMNRAQIVYAGAPA